MKPIRGVDYSEEGRRPEDCYVVCRWKNIFTLNTEMILICADSVIPCVFIGEGTQTHTHIKPQPLTHEKRQTRHLSVIQNLSAGFNYNHL